ncbi:hypothetical protein K491DRAFT_675772 [Lophiostoma macrostomum CBS 122681]|uniref:FAD/NAD(P)-binding domain-containing protein n=1 Tax=Lophiostoma macrostomum CBS 122681 TaxID=1314788 RepID=A0A6A6TJ42_9PLEO|nr:hypothetical protein K491DRAFT_675772 [Lophiostoma macrostomum CBS 122681]
MVESVDLLYPCTYAFWLQKTRSRIHDPRIADILAPTQQPYAFGCKRSALEQGFFEIFNEPHVDIVDVSSKGTPIVDITERGIKTSETEYEFDYIVCATGYDALTGGLRQIDITNAKGEKIVEHCKDGTKTHLGMAVNGFPNLFFTYGPQAPTAFCNGPTCAELQGDWIARTMGFLRERGLERIEGKRESEEEWTEGVWKLVGASLLPTVDSWYMSVNIPGKM